MYGQAGTAVGAVSMAVGMGAFGQSWAAVITCTLACITLAVTKSWRRSRRDAKMAALR